MADIFVLKGGAGGASSSDVTALKSEVYGGKTAITADSNDEPITGTGIDMNGGTYSPSSSAQTISCAGKRMLSNVVINAIPTSYVDPSSGQSVGW